MTNPDNVGGLKCPYCNSNIKRADFPDNCGGCDAMIDEITELCRAAPVGGGLTLKNAPLGTVAPAINGGRWCRVTNGWKWNGPDGSGGVFPRPGGDWNGTLSAPAGSGEVERLALAVEGAANVFGEKSDLRRELREAAALIRKLSQGAE